MSNWRENVFRMFSKTHQPPNLVMPPESKDLESNISQLKEFDDRRQNVCKELKKLNDCLSELNCNEKQLLESLNSATLNDLEKFSLVIDKWSGFLNEVSKNREDLWIIITRTSIDPLKKFQSAFNEMRSAIKRHEQLISDNSRYTQKVTKYKDAERTSTNIIKINDYQSKLAQTQSDLNTLRSVLERELPQFLQKRIDYMQPSLAALISAEILYSGSNLNACSDLNSLSDELSEAERQDRQSKLFDRIDSLSIVTS